MNTNKPVVIGVDGCNSEPGQVPVRHGLRQRVMIGTQQGGVKTAALLEQTFRVMGKQELIALEDIHDGYLLEELQDRGYRVSDESRIIERMTVHALIECLYETMRKQPDLSLEQVVSLLFAYAFRRCDDEGLSHVKLSRILGISPRAISYRYNNYMQGKPNKRLAPKGKQTRKEEVRALGSTLEG